jgi:hypothetical protein
MAKNETTQTLGLTYAELKNLEPCEDSLRRIAELMGGATKWGERAITAAQAREAGATLDDIVWAASATARSNPDVERRLRLWLADCAAHVLHIFEHNYPADFRPRGAILASRRFACVEIMDAARAAAADSARDAAWSAARDAAWSAARDAAWSAARAAAWDSARDSAWDSARDAARAAARDSARAAARDSAWVAARDSAWAAAWSAAWDSAWDAEETWQFDRLVMWLSDGEPADWPLPAKQQRQCWVEKQLAHFWENAMGMTRNPFDSGDASRISRDTAKRLPEVSRASHYS